MTRSYRKFKVGILGCGAIGSRIAKSCKKELRNICELTALYDAIPEKALKLARSFGNVKIAKESIPQLLKSCDVVVEATNAVNPRAFIHQALQNKKNVLVMSTGKILNAPGLFKLAQRNNCRLIVPSGAIAGMDAVKAARFAKIFRITLTTRKPISGFKDSPYLQARKLDLSKIKNETVLFDGSVKNAVKHFPQNINVAAVLALASGATPKIRIRILTAPQFKTNIHEIEVIGDFGRISTRTENMVCPDNPKTSYLAVLSAIAALKDLCS